MHISVSALDHLVVNVTDAEISALWYHRVLGMKRNDFDPGQGKPKRISMSFGNQKINLRSVKADKKKWFTADHEAVGGDDLCFLTDSTPEEAVAHLQHFGIAIEEGPIDRQGARGMIRSVYCRDPDGSFIEISSYKNSPS